MLCDNWTRILNKSASTASSAVSYSFIKDLIVKIVEENPSSVEDHKAGKDKAVKFLMGQVMKETKGTVNPSTAMSILKDKLDK